MVLEVLQISMEAINVNVKKKEKSLILLQWRERERDSQPSQANPKRQRNAGPVSDTRDAPCMFPDVSGFGCQEAQESIMFR